MFRTQSKFILAALLLCCAPACFAERADRDQPLYLEADQVLIDEAKKISTFTGNVQLTQGTVLMRGDKITVTEDKDGFKRGMVQGKTASFRQKREGLDDYVEGNGERIEYDMRAEVVNFYVQARVKRGADEVRGEHITYNVKTEIFQVDSGSTHSENTVPQRVRVILQPKSKKPPAASGGLPINPDNALPLEKKHE